MHAWTLCVPTCLPHCVGKIFGSCVVAVFELEKRELHEQNNAKQDWQNGKKNYRSAFYYTSKYVRALQRKK
jgi:hypothetical protein